MRSARPHRVAREQGSQAAPKCLVSAFFWKRQPPAGSCAALAAGHLSERTQRSGAALPGAPPTEAQWLTLTDFGTVAYSRGHSVTSQGRVSMPPGLSCRAVLAKHLMSRSALSRYSDHDVFEFSQKPQSQ